MKVLVSKIVQGTHEVTIIPAPGSKLAPVVIRGKDEAAVFAEVERVIAVVADRKRVPA